MTGYACVEAVLARKGTTVHTIDAQAHVSEAVARLNALRVGALVVVSPPNGAVGIISERDILARVIAAEKDLCTLTVSEIMSAQVHSVATNTSVQMALLLMTSKKCRHLPVIDGNDIVGIISLGDLTRWDLAEKDATISDLLGYIQHG